MTTSAASPHSEKVAAQQPRLGKSFTAAAIGNAVEWYDWTIYSTFAVYFSVQFFDPSDPTVALLSTFGIFAVGFFVRPLGGWLLGIYADRKGRKAALSLTIIMMAIPTFVISFAPTYATIGLAAPLVLTMARLVQGFAAGGESGGSMAFLSEIAPPGKRGMYTSMWYSTVAAGMIIATVLGYALSRALTPAQMSTFGWRIPFIIGGVAGLIGLWIRRSVDESRVFEAADDALRPSKNPLVILFRDYPRQTVRVFALTAGASVGFYTFVSYLPTLLIKSIKLPADQTFAVHTTALFVFMIALPLLGRLSDTVGRRPVGFAYTFGGAVAIVPLTSMLEPSFLTALLVDIVLMLLLASMYGVLAALMTEQFPTEMRAVGIGTPYNLATAVFGGTAPFLLTWLAGRGQQATYFGYVAVLMAIAGVALLLSKESHQHEITAIGR
ncbi:MFS transporter [Kribbella sp. NPDC050820]|uniref:MFS transporter n=1 Tax=Kribbella sp. NPDC050820 TaxID=3155408 RepID=UPI0033FE0485